MIYSDYSKMTFDNTDPFDMFNKIQVIHTNEYFDNLYIMGDTELLQEGIIGTIFEKIIDFIKFIIEAIGSLIGKIVEIITGGGGGGGSSSYQAHSNAVAKKIDSAVHEVGDTIDIKFRWLDINRVRNELSTAENYINRTSQIVSRHLMVDFYKEQQKFVNHMKLSKRYANTSLEELKSGNKQAYDYFKSVRHINQSINLLLHDIENAPKEAIGKYETISIPKIVSTDDTLSVETMDLNYTNLENIKEKMLNIDSDLYKSYSGRINKEYTHKKEAIYKAFGFDESGYIEMLSANKDRLEQDEKICKEWEESWKRSDNLIKTAYDRRWETLNQGEKVGTSIQFFADVYQDFLLLNTKIIKIVKIVFLDNFRSFLGAIKWCAYTAVNDRSFLDKVYKSIDFKEDLNNLEAQSKKNIERASAM